MFGTHVLSKVSHCAFRDAPGLVVWQHRSSYMHELSLIVTRNHRPRKHPKLYRDYRVISTGLLDDFHGEFRAFRFSKVKSASIYNGFSL